MLLEFDITECECEACLKDFPTFGGLPVYDAQKYKQMNGENFAISIDKTVKIIQSNNKYIAENHKNYPSKELVLTQGQNIWLVFELSKLASMRDGFPV